MKITCPAVSLTVGMVLVTGITFAVVAISHTRSLSASYEDVLRAEPVQKANPAGFTVKAFADELASGGLKTAPPMMKAGGLQGTLSASANGLGFRNDIVTFEHWMVDAATPGGYRLMQSQEFSNKEVPASSEEIGRNPLDRVTATLPVAVTVNGETQLMHGASPLSVGERGNAVALAMLPAFGEFAFFAQQQIAALRSGILLSAAIVGIAFVAGSGLSGDVSRYLTIRRRAKEVLRESEERANKIIEMAYDAFISINADGVIIAWNARAETIFGWSRSEAVGRDLAGTIIPPRDREAHQAGLGRYLASGDGPILNQRFEVTAVHRDGHEFPVEMVAWPVRTGETHTFNAIIHDVSEREKAQQELRLRGAALEAAANAIVITDVHGRIAWANSAFSELTGYSLEDTIGKNTRFLKSGMQDAYFYRNLWRTILSGQVWKGQLVNRRKDGRFYTEKETITPVRDEGGEITHFIAIKQDITARKRMEEALREQVRRDSLTDVLNHTTIIDELKGAMAAAGNDASCAVAMVDVDGLKATNDTYGHQVGDVVLIEVAGAMSKRGAIVGRYGGDEFLAVLPSAGRDEAEQYRREVLAALADVHVTESETGANVVLNASIGLATYPEDGLTLHEIVDLSDSAMYASRRQRPVGQEELSPSRTLGGERAAAMVGQIVPLLTASGPVEEKLRLVAHRLSVGAGYDAVNVDVFAKGPGLPSARSTFSRLPDEVTEAWQAERRRLEDEPILQHVKSTRHALVVEDPQHEERLTEAQRAVMRAAELRSAVVVPLFWEDDMIGVLSAASKLSKAFSAEDVEFLTAVATQITSVVRMTTLLDELQSTSAHLEQAREDAVLLLAASAEVHDSTTGQHLRSVRGLTEALAQELSYDEKHTRELGLAAVLHDIGKIRVQESILASTGSLTSDEMESMRKHTVWGAEFLAGHTGYELAATVAHSHHERWDGGGYPDGLAGEAIPAAATIVAVADAFDAITSDRPYRASQSVDHALREIESGSGTQFSPSVVEALVRINRRGELSPPAMETTGQQAA